MRTLASATEIDGISSVTALLRGATFRLADATLSADEVRLPFDFIDSANVSSGVSRTGYIDYTAPVMSAYVAVGLAAAFEANGRGESPADSAELWYDEPAGLLVLSLDDAVVARMWVTGLQVSVVVTDRQVGTHRLMTCT